MATKLKFSAVLLFVIITYPGAIASDNTDWPMWRYDHARSGVSEMTLTDKPILLWTRQMEEPRRCWPMQYEDYYTGGNPDTIGKISYDVSYEPVIGDGRLYVPSMVSDKVTSYSVDSGEELWKFYAGGPVRFAPVYNSGRLYFTSDDGYLYCLDASTGRLIWDYHGSFSKRMVLGNERVISMWPGRGGPVIMDGIIYFAAGVMPFEGIFIHAVDAVSGDKVWTNSTTGTIWNLHQHGGAYSFGGPSPQGYLTISGNKLIVPGGRTPPAVFDRHSGEFLYFNQASGMVGKGAGGYRVFASDNWFINHGMMYALEDGAQFGPVPGDLITEDAFIGKSGNRLVAHKTDVKTIEVEIEDRLQRGSIAKKYEIEELWSSEVPDIKRLYVKTSSHFVISKKEGRAVALVKIDDGGMPGEVVWEHNIDGEIWTIIAGNDKLLVVNKEGKIYCFGKMPAAQVIHYACQEDSIETEEEAAGLAASIIDKAGITGGYSMVLGGDNSELIEALIASSSMHIIVVEPDKQKTELMRQRFDKAGIYGKRVAVINHNIEAIKPLPYIYDLVIVDGASYSSGLISRIFGALRPYGGAACILGTTENLAEAIDVSGLKNGILKTTDDFALIVRMGSLPGSAQWTHQYGGPTNRTYSDDNLVKPPLGTLWFGGPSNHNALPRHHNGPIPQVAGGRLLILGLETLSARCVYTGRELWIKEIPGIGHPFTDLELEERFWAGNEVYMSNHPGANFIGSPYVSLEDAVYVIHKDRLMSIDAASGEIVVEFRLPEIPDIGISEFGHLLVSGDYLITTIDPQIFDDGQPGKTENWNATSSSVLLIMDRHSGDIMWTKKADKGFRHNAVIAGSDRVFVVDGLSDGVIEILQRRGVDDIPESELLALDISTGDKLWSKKENVFATWLGYYQDKDILLQGGRSGQRGAPEDEPRERLIAHNGLTGEILWENMQSYTGPLGLHPDMIISGRPGEPSFNPNTGKNILKDHPITGEDYNWNWHKYYGCGTMNTSKYLIMFRSGTAGYTDLFKFGGTGNFGGFRAGCTNNMVAADGMLNAPDYTRTCTCSYPMQTSVGLAHMPAAGIETWTLNRLQTGNKAIRALGINFGAQGNMKEDDVLWLEYPKVYGAGPELPLTMESDTLRWFRNHATWIVNGDEKYDWVASYGVEGITSMSVDLVPEGIPGEHSYTVTLYFAEPEDLAPGERVFDVALQGKKVLENFDIAGEAGGSRRVIRKEFHGVKVEDALKIGFSSNINSAVISGLEIVIDEQTASSPSDLY